MKLALKGIRAQNPALIIFIFPEDWREVSYTLKLCCLWTLESDREFAASFIAEIVLVQER